jgi:tetratricopeptide (TPR) repeat protein
MSMKASKNFFIGSLFFIGTILILLGVGWIVPENTIAQDKPTYSVSQVVSKQEADVKQKSKSFEVQRLTKKELEYMQNGQYHKALEVINKILEIDPQNPDVHYERGTMHIATNNPLAAISDFEIARDLYSAKEDFDSADKMEQLIDETQNYLVNSGQ